MVDELRQEHALGSSVSLSKRMLDIGGIIEINDFFYELIMGQPFEIVAAPEPFKD